MTHATDWRRAFQGEFACRTCGLPMNLWDALPVCSGEPGDEEDE